MKISFSTVNGNLTLRNGYGLAGYNMIKSLNELGHSVPFRDPTAPVEIAFCQPGQTEWANPDAYHIQYTPWESTEVPNSWMSGFNKSDEVWTPSPLIARWFADAGVTSPIKVYEHGLDPVWSPGPSIRNNDKFVFLHHGSPAPRKGAQMAVDAFLELFGGDDRYALAIKAHGDTEARVKDREGNIIEDIYNHPQIVVLSNLMPEETLVNLYRSSDALVYPGYGEGFGLIPLQALGVGIPTICTGAWAPYEKHLIPELTLDSRMIDSPWPHMHPGKMFLPSYEGLKKSMIYAVENKEELRAEAERRSAEVHKDYNWNTLTANAFKHIVDKFQ